MFSEAKVTEIYCLADDFCKEFAKYQENHMLPTFHKSGKHRNKPNRMSDAEIMLIMILFHSGGYRCFKHFYLEYVCKHLAHLFPRKVSYNRFVELEKEVLFPLAIFINVLKPLSLSNNFSSRTFEKLPITITFSLTSSGIIFLTKLNSCS